MVLWFYGTAENAAFLSFNRRKLVNKHTSAHFSIKAFDEAKKKYQVTFDDYPDEEGSWCFPKNVISKAQK